MLVVKASILSQTICIIIGIFGTELKLMEKVRGLYTGQAEIGTFLALNGVHKLSGTKLEGVVGSFGPKTQTKNGTKLSGKAVNVSRLYPHLVHPKKNGLFLFYLKNKKPRNLHQVVRLKSFVTNVDNKTMIKASFVRIVETVYKSERFNLKFK